MSPVLPPDSDCGRVPVTELRDRGGRRGLANGFRDDTFLHIVDAWTMGDVDRRRGRRVRRRPHGLTAFIERKGDRFKDSRDLALHLEEWISLFGGDAYPEARSMLEDVLEMWRSTEPKRRSTAKKRS